VLDRNLFEIPSADIHPARVLWTVVEGQEVYRAEKWDEHTHRRQSAAQHDRYAEWRGRP
jgi:hypothetical protein